MSAVSHDESICIRYLSRNDAYNSVIFAFGDYESINYIYHRVEIRFRKYIDVCFKN